MPKLSTPYCPKCGADIDFDTSTSTPDATLAPAAATTTSTPAPDTKLTRAMAVTILHRLAGEPAVRTCPSTIFLDVPSGEWFSNAIAWAFQHDILLETSGGRFAPRADVTREQFTTMLYRYATAMGVSAEVPANFHLKKFPDHQQISTWAKESMRWAVYHRLLSEADIHGALSPREGTTRAQGIAMLQRFNKVTESDARTK